MSDHFHPLPLDVLSSWISDELDAKDSIFGIPRALFFNPGEHSALLSTVYGHALEAPLGVAAGPHSQLAQNIVVAWLCGARFIELKTVQTLDQIEVSKPCIDMQDEGYNVEWSQELRVEESFTEYLNAWVLIHALHRRLGFPGQDPGLVFNLSVGYDLAGIRQPNMQWYLDKVEEPGDDLREAIEIVSHRWPEAAEQPISSRMSDNVTLSTMHGCPPDEIGAISSYLLSDRGLHTSVKLNPTLLGPERVRPILNDRLGFNDLVIPDKVFDEDLDYTDALTLLQELSDTAISRELLFGVKLTNTLAITNHRRVFDPSEETMYLSGRPLHALTVQLAHCLAEDVEHPLMLSFSGGADAHNVAPLIRSGMKTVTVCSDLLRPGGYLRFGQYINELESAMVGVDAESIEAFVRTGITNGDQPTEDIAHANLRDYADAVLSAPAYHRDTFERSHTKTPRKLGLFDCIVAPCTDGCDVNQKVPEYMRFVSAGDLPKAAEITRLDNPLASILGRTCHHPCEPVCLRTHMDQPLAIREIKRYITDHEGPPSTTVTADLTSPKVAVIGGGPCGLGAATFLARAGIAVTIFEARPASGGMVSATIPDYRAATHAVNRDLDHLRALGVEVRHNQEVGRDVSLESLRSEGFSSIVIAVGARQGLRLGIEGEESQGVLDGLDFLRAARDGNPPPLGKKIGVIGGGDVAMDCSRSACRLADGEVTVFYRRTRAEMPAQKEELLDLFEEGGKLEELMAPHRAIVTDGHLSAVEMTVMRLGEPDDSGRRRPEPIPGAERDVELDTLIVAIGQRPDLSLFGDEAVALSSSGYLEVDPATLETSIPGVYAGGDIIGDGPSNIVKACGDGRIIAEVIIAQHRDRPKTQEPATDWPRFDHTELLRRRARVEPRVEIPHLDPEQRRGFAEVVITLPQADAEREASRCLDCDIMCSTCDSVCPNRAILTYRVEPQSLSIPRVKFENGEVVTGDLTVVGVTQGPQVAVLTDACNECGNCVTFCPTSDRPWRDKPRLYLDRHDFEAETDNAFMFIRSDGARGLQARFGGALLQLIEDGDVLRFTSPVVVLSMDAESLDILESAVRDHPAEDVLVNPEHLGAMIVLHRAFADSMPEFPLVEADSAWLLRE
ncbi:MAG: putative selenate reductase subunit YgfK [Acidobacteria bacterium]|nr:putative selenate reductase subunit YgfK [Candidatus Sulfomarinibacter kjeldsenii]